MSISSHSDLTDYEFLTQFESCELPAELFNHEAHIRLAWLLIRQFGVEKAIDKVSQQIEAYVEHLGATDKFHKTLTVSAVLIVNHFMDSSNASSFEDFISENPRLFDEFKQLVISHYSEDVFSSEKARLEFIEPDLLPFR